MPERVSSGAGAGAWEASGVGEGRLDSSPLGEHPKGSRNTRQSRHSKPFRSKEKNSRAFMGIVPFFD